MQQAILDVQQATFAAKDMQAATGRGQQSVLALAGSLRSVRQHRHRGKPRIYSPAEATTIVMAQRIVDQSVSIPIASTLADEAAKQIERMFDDDDAQAYIFAATRPGEVTTYMLTEDPKEALEIIEAVPHAIFVNVRAALTEAAQTLLSASAKHGKVDGHG